MKRVSLFMVAVSLLFLTGCQQTENLEPQSEESVKSGWTMFEKVGDPRNPAEFMTAEDIDVIQGIFRNIEGKELSNPVIEIPDTKMSIDLGNGTYLLQDQQIPLERINGEILYINATVFFYSKTKTFDVSVSYCFGNIDGSYDLGYSSFQNKEVYEMVGPNSGTAWLLYDRNCKLEVRLKNNPYYNTAVLTFPFGMAWDRRVGYLEGCDFQLDKREMKVTYKNLLYSEDWKETIVSNPGKIIL